MKILAVGWDIGQTEKTSARMGQSYALSEQAHNPAWRDRRFKSCRRPGGQEN
jgi:hypothetical protein